MVDVMGQAMFMRDRLSTSFPFAHARKASTQSGADYSSGSGVVMSWDTIDIDTEGFWSSGANTKFTIPTHLNGHYCVITAQVQVGSISGSNSAPALTILKNGNVFNGGSSTRKAYGVGVIGSSVNAWVQTRTHVVPVVAGDEFTVRLYCVDTSIDIDTNSSFSIRSIGTSVAGALVRNASAKTTQNLSFTTLTWDTEDYDTDAFHDTGSNTGRFTIPAAYNNRYVIVKANMRLSLVTNGTNQLMDITKNAGTAIGCGFSTCNSGSGDGAPSFLEVETGPMLVATNDFFECRAQSSDNSVTIDATGTAFSIQVLPASFQGVMAKLNADAAANYTTPTVLSLNGTDVFDTDAAHDPSGNPTKVVVPAAWDGKYGILLANVISTTTLTSGSTVSVNVGKGGTHGYTGFGGNGGNNGDGGATRHQAYTHPLLLATGQEYTLNYWNGVDTAVTIESDYTFLSLYLLN